MSVLKYNDSPANRFERKMQEYKEYDGYLFVRKDLACDEGILQAGSLARLNICQFKKGENIHSCEMKLVDIDFKGKEKEELTVRMPITELDNYFRTDTSISRLLKTQRWIKNNCDDGIDDICTVIVLFFTIFAAIISICYAIAGVILPFSTLFAFWSPAGILLVGLLVYTFLYKKVNPYFIRKNAEFLLLMDSVTYT